MTSASDIRSTHREDRIDQRRRRRHRVWRFFWAGFWFLLAGSATAGFLWSPLAAVKHVTITGASASVEGHVRTALDEIVGKQWLGVVPVGRNMFLLKTAAVRSAALARIPAVEDVEVRKDWPDTLVINVRMREPFGIWCAASGDQPSSCRFWDESGARWGAIAPSVGPLLLLVRDERWSAGGSEQEGGDPKFFANIREAVAGIVPLGLRAKFVTLPDAEPGGMRVELTQGYELRMDAMGDIPDQLATLEVFLGDKAKDPGFRPAYIDLRTPGRVYFK